ncbi:MAG: cobyrinic acid a,c-diamide synthase [Rhodospirillales bacterium]|nr:MAG: cobyrinic acid a,c-diamide synthase [Rhodospirillales bacterium]
MTTLTPVQDRRPAAPVRARNLLAIASGKGGVGKTWFAITLAHALARARQRVLLFDGDLGLANVDIQLGLMPRLDLASVLGGQTQLLQAVTHYGAGNFDIIAGRSGSGCLSRIAPQRLHGLTDELMMVALSYDHVIIDLGGGIEQTVRELTRRAGGCIVIATDEPTALTDAYAFIKLTRMEQPLGEIRIVVNMAASRTDGERTYATLDRACQGFLKFSPPLLGVVRRDVRVREAIRVQMPLLTGFPSCDAALDVEAVAERLLAG